VIGLGKKIMSMDLSVWSSEPFHIPAWLPESERWDQIGTEWSFAGDGWQVVVMPAEDEVSVEVKDRLPDAQHVA
jgi:hypothetical protein